MKRKKSACEINMVKGGKLARKGKQSLVVFVGVQVTTREALQKRVVVQKKPRTSKGGTASASGTRNVSAS